MVEHKTDSGHTIGKEFPTQTELTENTTRLIRKINECRLTPKKKQLAIKNLKGITREEMEKLIKTTGVILDESIRALISPDRV